MIERDENDRLRDGDLPSDAFDGAEPFAPEGPSAVGGDWPTPAPLRREEYGPVLPLEGLPDWCQRPVADLASNVQSPRDYVVAVALGIVSGGVMGRWVLDHNGYLVHPHLSLLGILPSGERKSDPFGRLLRALGPIEGDLRKAREDRRACVRARREVLAARKKAILRKAAKPTSAGIDDELKEIERELGALNLPGPFVLVADDVTPEQAAAIAQDNDGLLRIYGDEGTFLQHLLGRYSDSPAIELFLNGWQGGRATIHRVTREPVVINRALVSVVGAVQPKVIQAAMKDERLVRRGGMARFLMVVPQGLVGRRTPLGSPIDQFKWSRFEGQLQQLYRTSPPPVGDAGIPEPVRVIFSTTAMAKFGEAFKRMEQRRGPDGDLTHLVEFVNKFEGHILKLSLLLWAAERDVHHDTGYAPNQEIPADYVERAVAFMEAQTQHQIVAARFGSRDRSHEHAGAILDHVARRRGSHYPDLIVSRRDIYRRLASRFDDPLDLDEPLALLERLGWLRRAEQPARAGSGRPPSERVEFHPQTGRDAQ